jgi:hypothetical protein
MGSYLRVSPVGLITCLVISLAVLPGKAGDADSDEIARLRKEVRRLKAELEKRDRLISKQNDLIAVLKKQTEALAKAVQATRDAIKYSKMDSPVQKENFPSGEVNGDVKELSESGAKIIISVGNEAGLQKGHKLHLYRLKPKPTYLGTVEIEAVGSKESTGKLVHKLPGTTVQKGDLVTSHLPSVRVGAVQSI